MQSLIQYVIVGCLTPALSYDSVMEMRDSRDVLETITDTQYTTDGDRWCWASLFQKQAKTLKKARDPMDLCPCGVMGMSPQALPTHSACYPTKPQ